MTFSIKKLTLAIAALSTASVAGAAGLDRSGQDISAFHQAGTYAEISYTFVDSDVSGYDNSGQVSGSSSYTKGNEVKDITDDYSFVKFAVKDDVTDNISIGVLYDTPFGADTTYQGQNNFTTLDGAGNGQVTRANLSTDNITGLVGMSFGDANGGFQVYGGPAYQRIDGDISLRGAAYGGLNGYDMNISQDGAFGWVAGAAYTVPKMALKAALTYRSEIDHEFTTSEVFAYGAPSVNGLVADVSNNMDVTTPESFNFDFQTGINKTTLATAKIRYVPWSDFVIPPPKLGALTALQGLNAPKGLPLLQYSDDQWSAEVGMAKRLSPALAVSGNVGYDSGAGNPTSSLGPVEGSYSVGLGAKYNVTPNWAVSAGGKYLWLGDAKGALASGTTVSDFQDNTAYAVGVKLSYQER